MQPITLYSHQRGPNPWKVALILGELGVPFETIYLEFPEAKVEPYIRLNPNGKLPAIKDPNRDIVLFESGAIIEYLIDQYDTESKLTHDSLQEKASACAWLHLQMSAQGPPCGYKVWMNRTYEADAISAANEFLAKEIKRVLGVLDSHLDRTGGPYLLGSKLSYADLAFVPHFMMLSVFLPGYEPSTEYPRFTTWLQKLRERPAVQKVMEMKAALLNSS